VNAAAPPALAAKPPASLSQIDPPPRWGAPVSELAIQPVAVNALSAREVPPITQG
jgi:hypothetical protein